jgi:hypothetical protein
LRRFGLTTPALDADHLRRVARQRTGLSDFGSWQFDEPLERLLRAYRDEADLTTLGRLTVRELIVSLLEDLPGVVDGSLTGERANEDALQPGGLDRRGARG